MIEHKILNVKFAAKRSLEKVISLFINEFIRARSHLIVTFANVSSHKKVISTDIAEFTLVRNLSNVMFLDGGFNRNGIR